MRIFALIVGLSLSVGALARAVTLEQCLVAAEADNPDLQAAAARVRAAQAMGEQARAAWYPQLKATAAYARTDNPPQAFMMVLNQRRLDFTGDFNQPDDTENLRLSAVASWRLYDGGRRGLRIEAADAGAEATRAGRAAALNALRFEVARSFYQALQARAFLEVYRAEVKSLQESLRIARERFDVGAALKTDVLNLEVRGAEADENLLRAGNAVELAVAALHAAVGRPLVADAAELEAPPDRVATPPGEPGDGEDRPEVRALQAARMAREKQVQEARRAYLPSVDAFGSSDWDSPVDTDFERSYLVGVAADLDLFDGHRRRSELAGAVAALEEARAAEAQLRNRLRLELQQAWLQAVEAARRIEVSTRSRESAEEALRITRERFEQGAAEVTELLVAQTGNTSSHARLVAARYDYLTALANLRRAQGLTADAPSSPKDSNP